MVSVDQGHNHWRRAHIVQRTQVVHLIQGPILIMYPGNLRGRARERRWEEADDPSVD